MEFEKKGKNPNPWETANYFSRLLFWWVFPLIAKVKKGNLKLSDIYDCPNIESSEKVREILQKEWDQELKKIKNGKHPSLIKAVLRGFGPKCCIFGLFPFVYECVIHVMQPVLLGYLINHFSRKKVLSTTDLSWVTAGICLLSIAFVISFHTYSFETLRMGMRIRVACCTLIYRKALNLSQAALSRTTVGQMVNLLTNDVNRFDNYVVTIPFIIIGPLQTIIVVCILWTYIGYASLVSVLVLLLYIFLQTFFGKLYSKFRLETAGLTDHRIRLMNEIVAGMRIIKMYGWELPYAKLVDLSRRKEVKVIRRAAALRGLNFAFYYASSKTIILATFVVFLLCTDGDFTPEKVFVCMALLNTLRLSMILKFYDCISWGAECVVSLRRIQKFLLLEEKTETSLLEASGLTPKLYECGIWMNNITASWNKDNKSTLREVTLTVKPGELLTVVGPVGSGKSSLLMSILDELPITSGELKVRGKVAYASQEPWVFSGSIRENIIFGSDFDEIKYKKVLNICSLDKDIEMFHCGDETLVGERGVCLSGGQKARVNLARAIYLDADILLLDDPLSAVDSVVSKHLFEKCINGHLKDKVRILVTHQIQFLKSAPKILVLNEGGCMAFGTYEELIKAGVDLGSLDKGRLNEHAEDVTPLSLNESIHSNNLYVDGYNQGDRTDNTSKNVPRTTEETKSIGSVNMKVYTEFIKSGASPLLRVIVLFFLITCQVILSSTDLWLLGWTRLEQRKYNVRDCWVGVNKIFLNQTELYSDTYGIFDPNLFRENIGNVSDDCFILTENYLFDEFDANQKVNRMFNLSVYAALVVAVFLFSLIREEAFVQMSIKNSIALHNNMFKSVLRSPIAFFDSNPVGRVLNRFANDVGAIDDTLPIALVDTCSFLLAAIGVFAVVAIIQPWILLPTAIIITLVVLLRTLCLPTLRDMKRYEGITRSPLFSHLSISMNGLTTIRAFKLRHPFETTFDHYQDQHTATFFMYTAVTRIFGMYLEWLCSAYSICVAIAMVVLFKDPSHASKVGLAIACTFDLGTIIQWSIRQSVEAESQMISVERVMEYSSLKPEAALKSEHDKMPPLNWPSRGSIVLKKVSLKYSPNEPSVLKNLNFEIYPEEKIGIVGRTGAGKSSIIATLFRMTEPKGVVQIDGVYTKNIGLHDLRKKISIIPQDPVLFSGPLRRNLDPFSEHKDDDLWKALEEAYLKQAIQDMPIGLDTEVAEGGSNFSVGQKQLICLARALLRQNKILVLDEATANVDPNTDKLIQQTIRDRFANCTVITIAHRLHTIMNSDRVLVLDAGEVKEFDAPFNLLQDPRSVFSQMVQMTGPGMAKQLLKLAQSAYLKNAANKEGSTDVLRESSENGIIDMNSTVPCIAEGHVNNGFQQTEFTHL